MTDRRRRRYVFDADTHYRIIKSETPVTVDGFAMGEPTGMIKCCGCGMESKNIDEIPHTQNCDLRWVRTHWWVDQMRAQGAEGE